MIILLRNHILHASHLMDIAEMNICDTAHKLGISEQTGIREQTQNAAMPLTLQESYWKWKSLVGWLVGWGLMALSAQIGYIVP